MLRSNLLFVHVASAMGMFLALGIEALALSQMRRASDGASARAALASFGPALRVSGPSAMVLGLSGLWLAGAFWHWQGAWMGLGLAGLVSIGAIGAVMTGRRVRALATPIGPEGPGPRWIEAYSALRTSFAIRATLLVGVVYLMTIKPKPAVSLGAVAAALAAGLLLGLVRPRVATISPIRATR